MTDCIPFMYVHVLLKMLLSHECDLEMYNQRSCHIQRNRNSTIIEAIYLTQDQFLTGSVLDFFFCVTHLLQYIA